MHTFIVILFVIFCFLAFVFFLAAFDYDFEPTTFVVGLTFAFAAFVCGKNTFYGEITRVKTESPLYYKIFPEESVAHFAYNNQLYSTKEYRFLVHPEKARIKTSYSTAGKWFKTKERVFKQELVFLESEVEPKE